MRRHTSAAAVQIDSAAPQTVRHSEGPVTMRSCSASMNCSAALTRRAVSSAGVTLGRREGGAGWAGPVLSTFGAGEGDTGAGGLAVGCRGGVELSPLQAPPTDVVEVTEPGSAWLAGCADSRSYPR